jgi:hypothetical protein
LEATVAPFTLLSHLLPAPFGLFLEGGAATPIPLFLFPQPADGRIGHSIESLVLCCA